jgi:hypothetical protein
MTDGIVITPGGARPKSRVHLIEPGYILDGSGDRLRKIDSSGRVVTEFGRIAPRPRNEPLMPRNVAFPAGKIAALGSGWITFAFWNNDSGTPISSFTTTWIVPPPPSTQSAQLIYLFNGIQSETMILQPVLQWGNNGDFGGNSWVVASWFADGQGGEAFHSQPVGVSPGDVLTGVMTLTSESNFSGTILFSYNCEFRGVKNSGGIVSNVQQLFQCVETLEAYNITRCSDYPNTIDTAMTAISIRTGTSTPIVSWTPTNLVTDCGQNTGVVSNSATSGEVDLFYGTGAVPAGQTVLLYDHNAGQADVVGFDALGKLDLDTTNSGWRTSWDIIVVADLVGNGRQQILLYDRNAGQADVVGFDDTGQTNLDTTNSGWRTSWDIIVVGDFVGNGRQQILLYDRNAGQADVVGFDDTGQTNLDTTNSGWLTSWDMIVVGDFVGNGRQQILLYDRNAGQADVVGFNDTGQTNLDLTNSGWRTSWNIIVAGDFVRNGQ